MEGRTGATQSRRSNGGSGRNGRRYGRRAERFARETGHIPFFTEWCFVYYVNYPKGYRQNGGLKKTQQLTEANAMLKNHPKHTPTLSMMLEELGNPSAAEMAKALGISEQTARTYKARNSAPRPVMLALFWVTSWGQQWAYSAAHNDADAQAGMAQALKYHCAELEKRIHDLIALNQYGSANEPFHTLAYVCEPARPQQTRQDKPVTPAALRRARHLKTGPASQSRPGSHPQQTPAPA
jgi:hypothetical protein